MTETERRGEQTKGTAATPASAALLPLIVSLVFNLEWFQAQRSTTTPLRWVGLHLRRSSAFTSCLIGYELF
jgi:hypothetical protein